MTEPGEAVTEPGEAIAADAGALSRLRATRFDRVQVIGTLKSALVQGRLTEDEYEARAGQASAARTHAELAALIADIPARLGHSPTADGQ